MALCTSHFVQFASPETDPQSSVVSRPAVPGKEPRWGMARSGTSSEVRKAYATPRRSPGDVWSDSRLPSIAQLLGLSQTLPLALAGRARLRSSAGPRRRRGGTSKTVLFCWRL